MALAIYLLVHIYVFISIKTGLSLSKPNSYYLIGLFFILALIYPLSRFFEKIDLLTYVGSIWLGVMSISFTVFLVKDIFSIFLPFSKGHVTYAALFITLLISVYSLINESIVRVKEINIPVNEKSQSLKGMTFVQVSDLHLGVIKNEKWLSDVVEKVNSLKPDLIFITGDIMDDRATFDQKYSDILKRLKSKYGVFACLGNHEYYAGRDRSIKFITGSNIDLLINSAKLVDNKFYVIGVDDKQGKSFGTPGPDLEKTMVGVDRNKYIILMAHNPTYFNVASSFNVDLMLSGHTHAGQIPPVDILVSFIYKHGYGLYKNGKGIGYTSSGTGSWGPPMRFLNSSEIVKFTFK